MTIAELLARAPQRVVVAGVERLDVGVVGDGRDEDAAAQAVARPTHLTSSTARSTSLRKTWATPARRCRVLGAPVGQPAVVRAQPGPALVELLARARRPGDEHAGREEGRHRVREDHLGDLAVRLEVGEAAVAVPVAGRDCRPADRGTGSSTRPATRRTRPGTPDRGTRCTRRSIHLRGSPRRSPRTARPVLPSPRSPCCSPTTDASQRLMSADILDIWVNHVTEQSAAQFLGDEANAHIPGYLGGSGDAGRHRRPARAHGRARRRHRHPHAGPHPHRRGAGARGRRRAPRPVPRRRDDQRPGQADPQRHPPPRAGAAPAALHGAGRAALHARCRSTTPATTPCTRCARSSACPSASTSACPDRGCARTCSTPSGSRA